MTKNYFTKYKLIFILISLLIINFCPFLAINKAIAAPKEITPPKRNVLYYGDWSIYDSEGNFYPINIPASYLTHLNFAFLDFDENGNLRFTDKDAAINLPLDNKDIKFGSPNAGVLNAFQELRANNPNLKIGISVGGWSNSGDFSVVTADPTKRKLLVNNLVKFLKYSNMDFVDIDWEYPVEVRKPDKVANKNDEGTPYSTPEDKQNFTKFLKELKSALNKASNKLGKTYELSVALPASKSKLTSDIEMKKVFNIVDFANMMTYDMAGPWNLTSSHHTPLYTNPLDNKFGEAPSVDLTVKFLANNGIPSNKIVVGVAYYTRGWNKVKDGSDPNLPGLFGEATLSFKDADGTLTRGALNENPMKIGSGGRAAGVWSYRNLYKLKKLYPNIQEYWDDTAKAPYLYDETTGIFFSYDNAKSITEKANYVNRNNLGGILAWMSSQDAPSNPNSSVRDELTKSSYNGLFNGSKLPSHNIIYPNLNISTSIKALKQGSGYEITITNNEKLQEKDEVLSALERNFKTIKLPIIYIDSNTNFTSTNNPLNKITNKDNQTIIELKGIPNDGNIAPGESYTFTITSDDKQNNVAKIKSIDLSQRITPNGPLLGKQKIYTSRGLFKK